LRIPDAKGKVSESGGLIFGQREDGSQRRRSWAKSEEAKRFGQVFVGRNNGFAMLDSITHVKGAVKRW